MAIRASSANFEEKVLQSSVPVVVDFYSDSCVACKRLVPVLGDLEDNYEGKLSVVKVNTNFDMELCEKYGVMSNPTVVLFKDGEEVDRRVGAAPYKEFEKLVAQYV